MNEETKYANDKIDELIDKTEITEHVLEATVIGATIRQITQYEHTVVHKLKKLIKNKTIYLNILLFIT